MPPPILLIFPLPLGGFHSESGGQILPPVSPPIKEVSPTEVGNGITLTCLSIEVPTFHLLHLHLEPYWGARMVVGKVVDHGVVLLPPPHPIQVVLPPVPWGSGALPNIDSYPILLLAGGTGQVVDDPLLHAEARLALAG